MFLPALTRAHCHNCTGFTKQSQRTAVTRTTTGKAPPAAAHSQHPLSPPSALKKWNRFAIIVVLYRVPQKAKQQSSLLGFGERFKLVKTKNQYNCHIMELSIQELDISSSLPCPNSLGSFLTRKAGRRSRLLGWPKTNYWRTTPQKNRKRDSPAKRRRPQEKTNHIAIYQS